MRRLTALLLFLGSAALRADQLRVATWNLDFNPQDSAWSADGERVARLASLVRTLNADVILLQAVPDPDRVARYRGLGASIVPVMTMDDFPRLAADLTRGRTTERIKARLGPARAGHFLRRV